MAAAADAPIWIQRPGDHRLFGRALSAALALHTAIALVLLLQVPSRLADGQGGSPLQVELLGDQAASGRSRDLPAPQGVEQVEPVAEAPIAPDPAVQPSEATEAASPAPVLVPLALVAPPILAGRVVPPLPAVPLATPDPAVPPLAEPSLPMTMAAPAPTVSPAAAPPTAVPLAAADMAPPTVEEIVPVEAMPSVAVATGPPPDLTRAAPPPPVAQAGSAQPGPPQPSAPSRAAPRPAQRAVPSGNRAASGAAPVGSGAAAAPGSATEPSAPLGEPPVVRDAHYRTRPTPPVYPSYAINLNITGTVVLRALVGRDGSTRELKVWRSSGHPQLDRAAYDAARNWVFAPASIGGQPIEAWVEVPVHFRLN